MKLCPICKDKYLREAGGNALSRKDNQTEICDDCGRQEALNELAKFEKLNEK